ncbi:hypothetical protein BOX15_Mlig022277g2 [Macrostomum lignano]|uniref:Uncharacterized protein n=1 Tax=Macrostomum lignano TaxID=282301 RepID=A0A267GL36_9PLAT|nr:hypothetical protein BOX15_Mlig022277g2 [Macrostomum lignano]
MTTADEADAEVTAPSSQFAASINGDSAVDADAADEVQLRQRRRPDESSPAGDIPSAVEDIKAERASADDSQRQVSITRPVSILKSPSQASLLLDSTSSPPLAASPSGATTPSSAASASKRVRFAKKIEHRYWFRPDPSQHAHHHQYYYQRQQQQELAGSVGLLTLLTLAFALVMALAMTASYCRAKPDLCAAYAGGPYWPEATVRLAKGLRLI